MENKNNISDLDAVFKDNLENFSADVPQGVWQNISSQVGTYTPAIESTSGGSLVSGVVLKVISGIAAATIIATGVYFVSKKETNTIQEKTTVSAVSSANEINTAPLTPSDDAQNNVGEKKNIETLPNGASSEQVNKKGVSKSVNAQDNYGVVGTGGNNNAENKPAENTATNSSESEASLDAVVTYKDTIVCPFVKFLINANVQNALWYNADGSYLYSGKTYTHTYTKPGLYSIKWKSGYTEVVYKIKVTKPDAAFEVKDYGNGKFGFMPMGTDPGVNYWWDFGDGDFALEPMPIHVFLNPEREFFAVRMYATAHGGCVDSSFQYVVNNNGVNPFIPTVFTPNNDGINDTYKVQIKGALKFQLTIKDVFGKVLFETNDKNKGWDGRDIGGNILPDGTYIAILSYQIVGQKEDTKMITIVKSTQKE